MTRNVPASIHQRLLNQARAEGRPFNELLHYLALERFLPAPAHRPPGDAGGVHGGLYR